MKIALSKYSFALSAH